MYYGSDISIVFYVFEINITIVHQVLKNNNVSVSTFHKQYVGRTKDKTITRNQLTILVSFGDFCITFALNLSAYLLHDNVKLTTQKLTFICYLTNI